MTSHLNNLNCICRLIGVYVYVCIRELHVGFTSNCEVWVNIRHSIILHSAYSVSSDVWSNWIHFFSRSSFLFPFHCPLLSMLRFDLVHSLYVIKPILYQCAWFYMAKTLNWISQNRFVTFENNMIHCFMLNMQMKLCNALRQKNIHTIFFSASPTEMSSNVCYFNWHSVFISFWYINEKKIYQVYSIKRANIPKS